MSLCKLDGCERDTFDQSACKKEKQRKKDKKRKGSRERLQGVDGGGEGRGAYETKRRGDTCKEKIRRESPEKEG